MSDEPVIDVLMIFVGQRYSSVETEDGTFAVAEHDRVLYPGYPTRAEADAIAMCLNGY